MLRPPDARDLVAIALGAVTAGAAEACARLASVVMMINLYSDTQTRPVEAMRAAMATAEVGDELSGSS